MECLRLAPNYSGLARDAYADRIVRFQRAASPRQDGRDACASESGPENCPDSLWQDLSRGKAGTTNRNSTGDRFACFAFAKVTNARTTLESFEEIAVTQQFSLHASRLLSFGVQSVKKLVIRHDFAGVPKRRDFSTHRSADKLFSFGPERNACQPIAAARYNRNRYGSQFLGGSGIG